METLRSDKLFKSFDGIHAVDGVTVDFPSSGITAIIGPNGAGKTTLLNLLTGFVRPDSGRCYFGHKDTTRVPPHRISRMGVARTFQDLRLITQVSVLDNVLVACPDQRGERLLPALLRYRIAREETRNRQAAAELLRFVGLEAQANDLAGNLSYGQQKLLTLACSLTTQARILFLDEPVAGVAPQMVAHILDLLRKLSSQGKVIIFIEHNIEAVRQIADHVIVMDDGKIVTQGPPAEVLEKREIMEAYLG
jgi:ABC-type branched-subunit amino acid transport system ATPase component